MGEVKQTVPEIELSVLQYYPLNSEVKMVQIQLNQVAIQFLDYKATWLVGYMNTI